MAYWIFKIADQELYPDVPGSQYVFDNTHSIRVQPRDIFVYLDKSENYSFTGTGSVNKITQRNPTHTEKSRSRFVRTVYMAHLSDVAWFSAPLSISPQNKQGRKNRSLLGIFDVNLLGWSQSMPSLSAEMYDAIMDLADFLELTPSTTLTSHSIPDTWATTKKRPLLKEFAARVFNRSDYTCIICGSSQKALLEAAHLSPYSCDKKNRANPSNGVCLCTYCHRALDRRLIALKPDGSLIISPHVDDKVAHFHFSRVSKKQRRSWLIDVTPAFLDLTVRLFHNYHS